MRWNRLHREVMELLSLEVFKNLVDAVLGDTVGNIGGRGVVGPDDLSNLNVSMILQFYDLRPSAGLMTDLYLWDSSLTPVLCSCC